jgi:hypothetical protein
LAAILVSQLGKSHVIGGTHAQAESGTTLALIALGLWVLYELARPLDLIRGSLIVALAVMTIGTFTIPAVAHFFLIGVPSANYCAWIAGIVAAGCALMDVVLRVVGHRDQDPRPSS